MNTVNFKTCVTFLLCFDFFKVTYVTLSERVFILEEILLKKMKMTIFFEEMEGLIFRLLTYLCKPLKQQNDTNRRSI